LIGFFASRLLKVPLCFDFQGSLTSEMVDHRFIGRHSPLLPLLTKLESTIDHGSDMVLTSSQHAADTLCRRHSALRGRVHALRDGVDIQRFRPREAVMTSFEARQAKNALKLPIDRPVVVYLGLLAEYQGTSLLLQAAKYLLESGRRFHLLVMGYPGEDYYRLKAQEMGLAGHATFTGRIQYELAPHYLPLGDVAVSPKVSQTEGNGKLLNYMAVGLPTVAFDTPVAREFLGDLGTYAEAGSSGSLAGAIDSLLQNLRHAQERGHALRQRAERYFSWQENGKRLLGFYKELWQRQRRGIQG
jgi:glycosyltransferase involved in cell wall biosynthesis